MGRGWGGGKDFWYTDFFNRVHALYFDKYLLYLVEIIAVFFCMGIVTLFD